MKLYFVFGGSKGIGAEFVRKSAKSGGRVIVFSRSFGSFEKEILRERERERDSKAARRGIDDSCQTDISCQIEQFICHSERSEESNLIESVRDSSLRASHSALNDKTSASREVSLKKIPSHSAQNNEKISFTGTRFAENQNTQNRFDENVKLDSMAVRSELTAIKFGRGEIIFALCDFLKINDFLNTLKNILNLFCSNKGVDGVVFCLKYRGGFVNFENRFNVENENLNDEFLIENENIKAEFLLCELANTALCEISGYYNNLQKQNFFSPNAGVVIVSSLAAEKIALNASGGYMLSKAAQSALARLWAVRLGPLGVRVNALSPTLCLKEENKAFYEKEKDLAEFLASLYPLKKIINTADICYAIDFLLKAKSITAQNLKIDAGICALEYESFARTIAEKALNKSLQKSQNTQKIQNYNIKLPQIYTKKHKKDK